MIPTVGRVVYYKSRGSKDGAYEPVDRAAIITIVNSPTDVGLCVLNPEGLYFQPTVNQGTEPGQWDWMPFQKGQAAKTEELERKLDEKS
ncbi:hypothetical protein [Paenibacillus sinopodophylli]|uniref:hypothetical protein n=1 Tax=Paenibacillus sinopodophylli TaxID=1837342 RepID=UPI001BB113DF|nr:hypothetical protein [Paenibacillus sinopodophylli]